MLKLVLFPAELIVLLQIWIIIVKGFIKFNVDFSFFNFLYFQFFLLHQLFRLCRYKLTLPKRILHFTLSLHEM